MRYIDTTVLADTQIVQHKDSGKLAKQPIFTHALGTHHIPCLNIFDGGKWSGWTEVGEKLVKEAVVEFCCNDLVEGVEYSESFLKEFGHLPPPSKRQGV